MTDILVREGGPIAVVGLGKTGLSAVRFLRQQGYAVTAFDANPQAPGVAHVRAQYPEVPVFTGQWDTAALLQNTQVLLSPGAPRTHPAIQAALAEGLPVCGDVEWFVRYARQPIIAITGSNGKSTVVSWVTHVLNAQGVRAQAGGNIGVPVLDLLALPEPSVYVLELSSFQLESLVGLHAAVASVLNVSPDHMDRYASFAEYAMVKQRIYRGAQHAVVHRADALTHGLFARTTRVTSFGLDAPDRGHFGVMMEKGERQLCRGSTALCPTRTLRLKGEHNVNNALAVLALSEAFGVASEAVIEPLQGFQGLPHRCQCVGFVKGAACYNDSKGTNVGAAIAAIRGLGPTHRLPEGPGLVLLLGGQGKGADFSELRSAVLEQACFVVTFGQARVELAQALAGVVPVVTVFTLEEALDEALRVVQAPGAILLSPACASLDQFQNFEARGERFSTLVADRVALAE